MGLLAVLLLNTVIGQRAFQQYELELRLTDLAEQEEALARAVQLAESPLRVERAARKLGMVPAAVPVFLRLADGEILGEPVPAPKPTAPVSFAGAPGVRPSKKPTPSLSATPSAEPVAGIDAQAVDPAGNPPIIDPALDPATALTDEPQAAPSPSAPAAAAADPVPATTPQGVAP